MLFILGFGEINTLTYGPEPFRRCGNCIGGDGDKLKRCANCEEVYIVAKNVKFWPGKRAIKTSATNASKKILKDQNTYILKIRKRNM